MEDGEKRIHRADATQVFALLLQARNILYDTIDGNAMTADFERVEFHSHQPLGSKGKRGLSQQYGEDDFVKELGCAV